MSELLKIFDSSYQEIGEKERAEVHRKGYWHETFHCWFYEIIANEEFIYLQHRSADKQDFPNLFDISAAGHLQAHEKVQDGIREVEEELGITLSDEELEYVGFFPMSYLVDDFIDREFANVFLVDGSKFEKSDFLLQPEEVQGFYLVSVTQLEAVLNGSISKIKANGISRTPQGKNKENSLWIRKEEICAHSLEYYDFLFKKLKEKLHFS